MKYNWLFILMLFISPFLTLCMNSWFSIWMSMEFNLMVFIVYLMLNNIYIYDLCMKYFLINSFGSSLYILMSNFSMFYLNNFIYFFFMNICIMLKLGMMPFHFWFMDLMKNLNWYSCLLLSTWQKFIPFILLLYMYIQDLMLILIFISGLFSMIFCMNQIGLKKILGYSSINHMCWMFFSLIFSEILWLMYFFIYFFINFIIMNILKNLNINYMMDLYFYMNNNYMKFFFLMLMFSLGGLPPFLGFIMKWYVIYYFILYNNFMYMFILIFFSLIFLYYYFRMVFNIMFFNYLSLKNFFYLNYNFNNYSLFMFVNIFLLIYMSMFLFFFYL
uniref:NADH dehydrogenase subunit 2 n=1 Tax=Binodoxys communis TaxID=556335 RepID=UPI0022FD8F3F|nr:NADH dehydrogenase subunit 2 [Binodoxys communis]WAL07387.1 NADH dehydrogenase subunit 2 [Binodoxys communis]